MFCAWEIHLSKRVILKEFNKKKSCIRETLNLSTDANNTTIVMKRKELIGGFFLFFLGSLIFYLFERSNKKILGKKHFFLGGGKFFLRAKERPRKNAPNGAN